MYPRKIWPQGNPRAPRRVASVGRIMAIASLVSVILLLLGGPILGGPGVQAQAAIRIVAATEGYSFSESLSFALEAQSATPIVEVILFYGMVDEPLVRRIYPDFVPGTDIQINHTERLEPGQFAPGTMLRTWWQIKTEERASLKTEVRVFEYTDTSQQWRALQGAQVDIFWYGRDEKGARDLLGKAEAALERLRSEMGVPIAERIRIYIYNSQRDMQPALSPRSEGYDDRVTTLGVAMGHDTLLLLGTHRDVESTLAHELSHIVVGIATDNPYADLPRWLDEGLAMYAEGTLPVGNQRALDDAIENDALLSIRSMTSYSGQASQVDLFYGEAFSIVDWMLRDLGQDKMQQLLMVFREGVRQEQALQRVYGMGLDQLDNSWRASLGLGPRRTPTAPAITSRSSTLIPGPGSPKLSLWRPTCPVIGQTGTCNARTARG